MKNEALQRWKVVYAKWQFLVFVVPVVVYFAVFKYWPLYFIQIAFRDYRITRSIQDSPWIGLKVFKQLFANPDFHQAILNTVIINAGKLIVGFPLPILLAILLNELRGEKFKRVSQSILYLPHFISWAVMGGILYSVLSIDHGVLNSFLTWLGFQPIYFLGDPHYFRAVLILSEVWKSTGWGTILYLAALARIDVSLYEAAYVDGASRFQRIRYIVVPSLASTIAILFILQVGHLMDLGFEQILVMMNPMVKGVADIIDTYVYRVGLQQANYSMAAAAGLFKTGIAFIMLFGADRLAKVLGQRGVF